MLQNTIDKWLLKPEFNSGLLMLQQYSKNKAILFFFENKMYGLDRMVSEVKKIQLPDVHDNNVVNIKTPAVIKGIIDAKNIAWKEARDLHARLMGEPSKTERHKMALRITELSAFVKECWYNIDRYNATGDYSFLTAKKEIIQKPDLYKLFSEKSLKNNYIIKAKKELTRIDDVFKKQQKANHLASLEADIQAIDSRISFLNEHIIQNNL